MDIKQTSIEDEMFFMRLRRHAKWMFLFLAIVLGGGFVLFGVGAGGTGVGDIFRGNATGDVASVSDAREAVQDNPRDADAHRELATALETEGENEEAIVALTDYLELRPTDQDAFRELAGLYLTEGNLAQQDAQNAQIRAGYLSAGSTFGEPLKSPKDEPAIGEDPIAAAITAEAQESINAALGEADGAYTKAVETYEQLVKLIPNDPNVQLELAQTAEQKRDYPRAIAAYQKFLKLAPEDSSAGIVREQIRQLQEALKPAASG